MSAVSTLGFLVSSAPSFQLLSHPLHCAAEEAGAIAEQVFHNQLTRITIQGLEEAKHMEPTDNSGSRERYGSYHNRRGTILP